MRTEFLALSTEFRELPKKSEALNFRCQKQAYAMTSSVEIPRSKAHSQNSILRTQNYLTLVADKVQRVVAYTARPLVDLLALPAVSLLAEQAYSWCLAAATAADSRNPSL